MRDGLTGIDHAVVLVRDLDAAEAAWRRLGFAPTPRGHHTLGSSNHCMMFERDYLELLAVPTPHPSMAYFTAFLARGEGLAAFAFASDDGLAAHAAFVRDGIAADPPFEFSRPVERAGGRDARFRIVQLPESATPGMRAFVCQQFTPEVVWLPQDVVHPNGATALAGITVACDDPQRVAAGYARLAGVAPQAGATPGTATVRVGRTRFDFEPRAGLAARLGGALPADGPAVQAAAIAVGVRDPARVRALLAANGVPAIALAAGAIAVPAVHAQGVAVVFTPPED
jgi:hypothetical protein